MGRGLHLAYKNSLTVPLTALVQKEMIYVNETLRQNGYPECFLIPQCSLSRKDKEEKDVDPGACVTIPYIQCVLEAVTRILSAIDALIHVKPL